MSAVIVMCCERVSRATSSVGRLFLEREERVDRRSALLRSQQISSCPKRRIRKATHGLRPSSGKF